MGTLAWIVLSASLGLSAARAADPDAVARTYATVVHLSYDTALADAIEMQAAIDRFLAAPDDAGLEKARRAWLAARDTYGQTEAFRFYEGPIDFVDREMGREGPELRLNAWPMDETFIVALIQNFDFAITRESLVARNAVDDDAHVSTGFHAIEFLLWGQDLDPAGPGARSFTEFEGSGEIPARRREYLRIVTRLVVDDLRFLVEEWAPGRDNYAAEFLHSGEQVALRRIFGGLIQLAGFELAMERLAIPLDSGDQEDEHSCFSDNTHADLIANVTGIRNVYSGTYGDYRGTGVDQLAARVAPELSVLIEEHLSVIEASAAGLARPFDAMLASPAGSAERRDAERLVQSLRLLADLLGVLRIETGKVDG